MSTDYGASSWAQAAPPPPAPTGSQWSNPAVSSGSQMQFGVPPMNGLYPTVSAQSNSLPPTRSVTPTSNVNGHFAFNSNTNTTAAAGGTIASNIGTTSSNKLSSGNAPLLLHNTGSMGSAGAPTTSMPQNNSAHSLTALTGNMNKLSITPLSNATTGGTTPYNPYNGAFTPSCVTTPGRDSAANTPNPQLQNGQTPTSFGFNSMAPYSYAGLTPTGMPNSITPTWQQMNNQLHIGGGQGVHKGINMQYYPPNMSNMSNVQTMKIPLHMPLGTAHPHPPPPTHHPAPPVHPVHPAHGTGHIALSPSHATTTATVTKSRLSSSARPYDSTRTGPITTNSISPPKANGVKPPPSGHYSSVPSYAQAVNKEDEAGGGDRDSVKGDQLPPMTGPSDMNPESTEAIQKLNPPTWPSKPRHAKFYVIKSFGEDDVHKSIKYNLWCSTERGNRKLDEAFNEAKRINAMQNKQRRGGKEPEGGGDNAIDPRDTTHGCPVYLFYSVNRSGCFCGMAQMISNYYSDRHFGSWVQDGKWQGSFIVKWIYVKDIPNKDLKDIQLPNNDRRPVTFSRDTQEIPYPQGAEMLRRFVEYEPKTNILQDFKYYDDRERDIKMKRTEQILMQKGNDQMKMDQALINSARNASTATAANGVAVEHGVGMSNGYSRGRGSFPSRGRGISRGRGSYRSRGRGRGRGYGHYQRSPYFGASRPDQYGRGRGRGGGGARYNGNYTQPNEEQGGDVRGYGDFQILKRDEEEDFGQKGFRGGRGRGNRNRWVRK